jgi:hypothetical protein
MFMQNFNYLAFTEMDLEKCLTNIKPNLSHLAFLQKIQNFFELFLTSEFALEISIFQNSEYEVHQSRPFDEG